MGKHCKTESATPMKNFRAIPRPEAEPSEVLVMEESGFKSESRIDNKDHLFNSLLEYAENIGGLPFEYIDENGKKHSIERYLEELDTDEIELLNQTSEYETLKDEEIKTKQDEEWEHWTNPKIASDVTEADNSYLEWDIVDMMMGIDKLEPKSDLAKRFKQQCYNSLQDLNNKAKISPKASEEIIRTMNLMAEELGQVISASTGKYIKVSLHEDGSRLTDEMEFKSVNEACNWIKENYGKN